MTGWAGRGAVRRWLLAAGALGALAAGPAGLLTAPATRSVLLAARLTLDAAGGTRPPLAALPAALAASDRAQVAAVPAQLRGDVLDAAARAGLPPALLAAVADVESSFRAGAVGPPCPGGPALGLMQFLPSSWTLFNRVPGATPFEPGPALLAAAAHLLSSGALAGGGWSAAAALFGYNHSPAYVTRVLAVAAGYGWQPASEAPDLDPARRSLPLAADGPVRYPRAGVALLPAAAGQPVLAVAPGVITQVTADSVTLRAEDGWVMREAAIRPVAVLAAGQPAEPGELVGLTRGPLILAVSRAGASGPPLRAYLAAWRLQ